MNRCYIFCISFAFCFVLEALSQSESARPLPGPPYLRVLPADMRWTIKASSGGESETEDRKRNLVISRQISKSDDGREETIRMANGQSIRRWLCKGYEIVQNANGSNDIIIIKLTDNPDRDWIGRNDFGELGWIAKEKPLRWEQLKGENCLYFEAEMPYRRFDPTRIRDLSSQWPVRKIRAWIDPSSLRPIAYDDGVMIYYYDFAESTSPSFLLPIEVGQRLDAYIKRRSSMF